MNNEDIIAQHEISVGCRSEHGLVCEVKAEIFKSQNLIDFFFFWCACVFKKTVSALLPPKS